MIPRDRQPPQSWVSERSLKLRGTLAVIAALALLAVATFQAWPGRVVNAASPPGAPTNVTAAAGDATAYVTWAPPASDGGSPITSYTIGVLVLPPGQGPSPAPGIYPLPTVGGDSMSATIGGLANGSSYTFWVRATNAVDGGLLSDLTLPVTPIAGAQGTAATIPPGGGSATTAGTGPTPSDPVTTTVIVPATGSGGTVTITETAPSGAPTGFVFVGQQINIISTAPTDVSHPLTIVFNVDPSLMPATVFRNGIAVDQTCSPAGTANPTPCVSSGAGTTTITVLTASASTWNVGVPQYAFSGFLQPLNDPISSSNPMSSFKLGSTIAVKFALTYGGAPLSDTAASAIATACGARISLTQTAGNAPLVDEVVASTTANTGNCFRYDSGAHQFIFNLGTKGDSTSLYKLRASIFGPDGTFLAAHSLALGLR
jgi:Fibronectin type III domain